MQPSKPSKGTGWRRLALLATVVLLTAGCSSAYRCYEGGCINCRYCPRKPLAYSTYTGCPCHSDAADRVAGQSTLP